MIDTGYEHSLGDVEKRLHSRNIGLSDIRYVFLTHAHDDHAGFLNEMLGRNRDLKVIISDQAMAVLKRGISIDLKMKFRRSGSINCADSEKTGFQNSI